MSGPDKESSGPPPPVPAAQDAAGTGSAPPPPAHVSGVEAAAAAVVAASAARDMSSGTSGGIELADVSGIGIGIHAVGGLEDDVEAEDAPMLASAAAGSDTGSGAAPPGKAPAVVKRDRATPTRSRRGARARSGGGGGIGRWCIGIGWNKRGLLVFVVIVVLLMSAVAGVLIWRTPKDPPPPQAPAFPTPMPAPPAPPTPDSAVILTAPCTPRWYAIAASEPSSLGRLWPLPLSVAPGTTLGALQLAPTVVLRLINASASGVAAAFNISGVGGGPSVDNAALLQRAFGRLCGLLAPPPPSPGTRWRRAAADDGSGAGDDGVRTVRTVDVVVEGRVPSGAPVFPLDEEYWLTAGCDALDATALGVGGGEAPSRDSSIRLRARSVWGALRGLETLSQLVLPSGAVRGAGLPLAIHDAPRFPWRGFLIDTARHYLGVTDIRRAIDALAYNKFNTLVSCTRENFLASRARVGRAAGSLSRLISCAHGTRACACTPNMRVPRRSTGTSRTLNPSRLFSRPRPSSPARAPLSPTQCTPRPTCAASSTTRPIAACASSPRSTSPRTPPRGAGGGRGCSCGATRRAAAAAT
jgi:hypothetical protein